MLRCELPVRGVVPTIRSKADYHFYLEADRIALNQSRRRPRLFADEIWKFERLLRKAEYYENCRKGFFSRLYLNYVIYRLHRLSPSLGFTIPRNVFGPGLSIAHYGPIVVNGSVRVGANCRIHHCVTIGTEANADRISKSPKIGDNVFIGPGVVIVGEIEIANGVAIGANSYVDKSFTEPNVTIAGVACENSFQERL